jgi:hypothetical protein
MLTERDEGLGKFLEEQANETRDLTDVLFPDGVPAAGKKKNYLLLEVLYVSEGLE